jgi:polysaccharide export outer membrane protein
VKAPRRLSLFVAALALLALAAGCGGVTAPIYDYAQEPDPRGTEYVLGVGDDLEINVWENGALNTDATIRPDGTITMPLVGDLKAAGETPSSLRKKIAARLADYIKLQGEGTITVALRQTNSYRFTVSGEVSKSGVFNSAFYVTVAEAIALAGGFTRFAKRNEMVLLRTDAASKTTRSIPLAYDLLASGKRPDMNLVLLAGDSLYVP